MVPSIKSKGRPLRSLRLQTYQQFTEEPVRKGVHVFGVPTEHRGSYNGPYTGGDVDVAGNGALQQIQHAVPLLMREVEVEYVGWARQPIAQVAPGAFAQHIAQNVYDEVVGAPDETSERLQVGQISVSVELCNVIVDDVAHVFWEHFALGSRISRKVNHENP